MYVRKKVYKYAICIKSKISKQLSCPFSYQIEKPSLIYDYKIAKVLCPHPFLCRTLSIWLCISLSLSLLLSLPFASLIFLSRFFPLVTTGRSVHRDGAVGHCSKKIRCSLCSISRTVHTYMYEKIKVAQIDIHYYLYDTRTLYTLDVWPQETDCKESFERARIYTFYTNMPIYVHGCCSTQNAGRGTSGPLDMVVCEGDY